VERVCDMYLGVRHIQGHSDQHPFAPPRCLRTLHREESPAVYFHRLVMKGFIWMERNAIIYTYQQVHGVSPVAMS
jgi:hypothetical protein